MTTPRRTITAFAAFTAVSLALSIGAGFVLWEQLTQPGIDPRRAELVILPAEDRAEASADAEAADVTPREMPRIKPGVKIALGRAASGAEGMNLPDQAEATARSTSVVDGSRLLLHGVPRVAEGDVAKVPPSLARLVGLFHLTIMADVARDPAHDPPRYRLAQVAIGLATDVSGEETIVATRALGSLGVTLGFVERSSLAGNEACLDQALQVARTPTMLVFDATAIQRLGQHNRHVLHRHAILVEPSTGLMVTVVWALEPDSGAPSRLIEDKMRLLPAALEEDRKLYVDADKFVLGVPAQEAFALVDLPPGKELVITNELRGAAAADFHTPDDALHLERLLRAAVESARQE